MMNFGYIEDNDFYHADTQPLKTKGLNLDEVEWCELVKIIQNPTAYDKRLVEYVNYWYRVQVDIYNGFNIDTKQANAKLNDLYKEIPDNIKWR